VNTAEGGRKRTDAGRDLDEARLVLLGLDFSGTGPVVVLVAEL
jgi:hypothetical protein